jgi:ATP-dependent DNA helicase RecQ
MLDPVIVVRGTDRPNLFLEVVAVEEEKEDERVLRNLLEGGAPDSAPHQLGHVMQGSGIIYTATTRGAQETARWLREWGISAEYYHGQRRKSDRERVQAAFMNGEVRVIVATNAFGLGVDKPDVRFVIHRDVPASVEAYYQEAGRAGRDGDPARCVLVYRTGDLARAAFLAGTSQLTVEDVDRAFSALRAHDGGTLRELQAATELSSAELRRTLQYLKSHGVVAERRGRFRLLTADFDPAAIPLEREEQRRAYERSRLEMMRSYAELRDCRRRYILNYFGEEPDWQHCEHCDVDLQQRYATRRTSAESTHEFSVNDTVEHVSLGRGVVQRVTSDTLTVLFDEAGYKTLGVDIIQEQALLSKADAAA